MGWLNAIATVIFMRNEIEGMYSGPTEERQARALTWLRRSSPILPSLAYYADPLEQTLAAAGSGDSMMSELPSPLDSPAPAPETLFDWNRPPQSVVDEFDARCPEGICLPAASAP